MALGEVLLALCEEHGGRTAMGELPMDEKGFGLPGSYWVKGGYNKIPYNGGVKLPISCCYAERLGISVEHRAVRKSEPTP